MPGRVLLIGMFRNSATEYLMHQSATSILLAFAKLSNGAPLAESLADWSLDSGDRM